MAKPLGPKSILIREAITANPDLGNKEIAQLLSGADERKADKIKVTPQDIAQQKQAMKKAGETVPVATPAKRGRPKGSGGQPKKVAVAAPAPRAVAQGSPVDVIDRAFALADECGGIEQLKRLVDRLAQR